MLDSSAGQNGLFTEEHAQMVEEGYPIKSTGLSMDGTDNHYDAACAGQNAAALAVDKNTNPESNFSIKNEQELRNYVESFENAMKRRIGEPHLDRALESLKRALRGRGVDTTAI